MPMTTRYTGGGGGVLCRAVHCGSESDQRSEMCVW